MISKEELEKIFKSIINNYDKFKFNINVEPQSTEMYDITANGKRFTTYIRTITIEDKEALEETVKKDIWWENK